MSPKSLKPAVVFFGIVVALFSSSSTALTCSVTTSSSTVYPIPWTRFYLSNLSAAYFSENRPVSPSLFGSVRKIDASSAEQIPYAHPRVVMGSIEWKGLLERSADPLYFMKQGTWSRNLFRLTNPHGPASPFVKKLAALETSGETAVFTGQHADDFPTTEAYNTYRMSLTSLADNIGLTAEPESHHLFLCAFWASVEESRSDLSFLEPGTMQTCMAAAVAWSKVLLAHRTLHCNPTCSSSSAARTFIWNFKEPWSVSTDWFTSGASLALTYDVLYPKFSESARLVIRSALVLLTMGRFTWGTKKNDDPNNYYYPDPATYPHRIFSNWGMYHSNLYITALAIENEREYLPYAEKVLKENDAMDYNSNLINRFDVLIDAYFTHSIYPDGMSFEDGYTWHIALREGALGFVARQRRGGKILETARFRNAIHAVAQMTEPWQCGSIVGHSSGGGLGYITFAALFRYAYPHGVLSRMVWAQRVGRDFDITNCRHWFFQTMMQIVFFGGEHGDGEVPDAPERLAVSDRSKFPLAFVGTRRGLIIVRGSHAQKAAYLHFDARPDSFFPGHDNADRGAITFSALKQTWLDDHLWSSNVDSRRHSLIHVDGLAQDVKAPSVTILRVQDRPDLCIAAADLSYPYNVQWAKAWQTNRSASAPSTEYNEDGTTTVRTYRYIDAETNSPWDLGWPMEDAAIDIGFMRGMCLMDVSEVGFRGINEWRRPYREQYLKHVVRSTAMIRSKKNEVGVVLVVDSIAAPAGTHTFESYLILNDKASVDNFASKCMNNGCLIKLNAGNNVYLDVHVIAKGSLDYRVEVFKENSGLSHRRVIVRSRDRQDEEIWMALHAHEGELRGFSLRDIGNGVTEVVYEGDKWKFEVEPMQHIVTETKRLGDNVSGSGLAGYGASNGTADQPKERICDKLCELLKKYGVQDYSDVENANKYQSPIVATGPVMAARDLKVQEVLEVPQEHLNNDRATFYHDTNLETQIVTRIRAATDMYRVDHLITCHRSSQGETHIAVFDCGNGDEGQERFLRRKCDLLGESRKEHTCVRVNHAKGVDMLKLLQEKHEYYVVVSMGPPRQAVLTSPALIVAHSFKRLGREKMTKIQAAIDERNRNL